MKVEKEKEMFLERKICELKKIDNEREYEFMDDMEESEREEEIEGVVEMIGRKKEEDFI